MKAATRLKGLAPRRASKGWGYKQGCEWTLGCNRWDGGWIQVREEKVVKDEAAIWVGVERDTGVCGETDEMSLNQVVSSCLVWWVWFCRSVRGGCCCLLEYEYGGTATGAAGQARREK